MDDSFWDDDIDWETVAEALIPLPPPQPNHHPPPLPAIPYSAPEPNPNSYCHDGGPVQYTTEQLLNSATELHPFDAKTISSWLYPTNLPIREYQYNIVQKALFSNTLVSIPTGMGKTFIAAVVMVNYYRWFPESKIIFLTPTRPLTMQQQEACTKITGIPVSDQIVFVGSEHHANARRALWASKRVIFSTPQIMHNDLTSGICPADMIVCVVVDEAHRSTGNYAYVNVIRDLHTANARFRVLALSATPGSSKQQVQEIVTNLHINHIEIRTEDSVDLRKYFFCRNVDTMVVPMHGVLNSVRVKFMEFAKPIILRLATAKAIQQESLDLLHPYSVQCARNRILGQPGGSFGHLFPDFAALHKLAIMYDTLVFQSIRAFKDEVDNLDDWLNGSKKPPRPIIQLIGSAAWKQFGAHLRSVIQDPQFVSHPKLEKLGSILLEHFMHHASSNNAAAGFESNIIGPDKGKTESKVIVFAKYRLIVEEIFSMLEQHTPIIRPITFVGQSKGKSGERGLKQREQLAVLQRFQKGSYNVLVSTSVGEEGLDIGEVDLIICYDSSQSPIQMQQRMGRTARKRVGRVVLLLSQGREEQSYRKSQSQYKNIQSYIGGAAHGILFATDVPAMLPAIVKPFCIKMHFSVPDDSPDHATNSLRRHRSNLSSTAFLSADEAVDYVHRFAMHPNDPPLPLPLSLSKHLSRQIVRRGSSVQASLTSSSFFRLLEVFAEIETEQCSSLPSPGYCNPNSNYIDDPICSHQDSSIFGLSNLSCDSTLNHKAPSVLHHIPPLLPKSLSEACNNHSHLSLSDLDLFEANVMSLNNEPLHDTADTIGLDNDFEINWTPIDDKVANLLSNYEEDPESLPYYITGVGTDGANVPIFEPDFDQLFLYYSPDCDDCLVQSTIPPDVHTQFASLSSTPHMPGPLFSNGAKSLVTLKPSQDFFIQENVDPDESAFIEPTVLSVYPIMPPSNIITIHSPFLEQGTPLSCPGTLKRQHGLTRHTQVVASSTSHTAAPRTRKKQCHSSAYLRMYLDLEADVSGSGEDSPVNSDASSAKSINEWVDDQVFTNQPSHFYRAVMHDTSNPSQEPGLALHCVQSTVQDLPYTQSNCYDLNDSFLVSSSSLPEYLPSGTLEILESKLEQACPTQCQLFPLVEESQNLPNHEMLNFTQSRVPVTPMYKLPRKNCRLILDSPEDYLPCANGSNSMNSTHYR